MNTEGYRADSKAIYEAVKYWRTSELYRDEDTRVSTDEQVTIAPWLVDADLAEAECPISARWGTNEGNEGPDFEDIAEESGLETVEKILAYVCESNAELAKAVLDVLEQNEGKVLCLSRAGETNAFALQYVSEGKYLVASMDLTEALVDEGLISMTLLATTVPDGNAPVVPGFQPVEQKLYEHLHAAESLLSALIEGDSDELANELRQYCEDISAVLAEVAADEGSLDQRQLDLVQETFTGTFAGFVDEAKKLQLI